MQISLCGLPYLQLAFCGIKMNVCKGPYGMLKI